VIERLAGAAVSLTLAAGATVATAPTVRSFFGTPFEVPSMIAALFGCIITRIIVGQSDKVSRWFVRVPIDALTGGVTFFLVLDVQPGLLTAMVLGITIASLGATIIKIAEARGRKVLDALLPGAPDKQ
jgi:hypothetical protein